MFATWVGIRYGIVVPTIPDTVTIFSSVVERRFAALALLLVLPATAQAQQSVTPQRIVHGTTLTSQQTPAVRIVLPKSAHYVGNARWVLYGIANCDLYVFVEAGPSKKIERLYWIQFEGYLPSLPKLVHTYDSPHHAWIGGMDFYVDSWLEAHDVPPPPPDLKPLEDDLRALGYAIPPGMNSGSDDEHIDALLKARGYRFPAGMMSVRLVHLVNGKRSELMVIYSEDVATTGHTVMDLRKGGRAFAQWPAIAAALLAHAERNVSIRP